MIDPHEHQDTTEDDEIERLPYPARVAMCYMEVWDEGDDVELYDQLCKALREDSRVENIIAPTQEPDSFDRPMFSAFDLSSYASNSGQGDAPDPAQHTHAFHFPDPIILEVRSPRRLQPTFNDFDDIPADRYWAAWDGIALTVLWELEDFKKTGQKTSQLSKDDLILALSPSGGMLVQAILADAAKKCGNDFIVTPCSPVCSYPFAHTGLAVEPIDEYEEGSFTKDSDEIFARVLLPTDDDSPKEVVEELYRKLAFITRIFAEMRSNGRTIISARSLAHHDLRSLLATNYRRAVIGSTSLRKTLKVRWRTRSWRKEIRQLIARMWLTLATLNNSRRKWENLKYIYDDAAEDDNTGIVLAREYKHEVHAISTVDVTEVKSALERITNTMDTWALTLATGIGAIIGAIIGALIGHFI